MVWDIHRCKSTEVVECNRRHIQGSCFIPSRLSQTIADSCISERCCTSCITAHWCCYSKSIVWLTTASKYDFSMMPFYIEHQEILESKFQSDDTKKPICLPLWIDNRTKGIVFTKVDLDRQKLQSGTQTWWRHKQTKTVVSSRGCRGPHARFLDEKSLCDSRSANGRVF